MTLGNAIKLIRTSTNSRQRELAGRLKVSPNYISLLENGKREPSISFLRNLAKELGVPIGLFFLWEGTPLSGLTRNQRFHELRDLMVQIQALSLRGRPKRSYVIKAN
jgi:transcriptional regulator with XRE-family HTH domain